MDNTGTKRLVRALAFFERALLHRFQSVPYQNVAQRSQGALRRLGGSRTSLRFRVALQQLRFDWDLLSAESALDPDALRLQLKVLELAPEHPEAADAVRHEMEKVPIGRLFLVVVAEARQNDAQEIDVAFGSESIQVEYDGDAGMTIPKTLDVPFRGVLRYVESAGYSRLRAVVTMTTAPCDVGFDWRSPDRVVLTLGAG